MNVRYTFSGTWRTREGVRSVCSGHELVRDLHSYIFLKVFSPEKAIVIGFSILLSVCTLNTFVRTIVTQTGLVRTPAQPTLAARKDIMNN